MKPRVLWIEDSAKFELTNLTGPVYFSGKYDFQQAGDVTTAVAFIRSKIFDVLIVDLRLPPGVDSHWIKKTGGYGGEKLGLDLLYWLLIKDNSVQNSPPDWIRPTAVGVFTVESFYEISGNLHELGIEEFCQKTAGLPDTALYDMIGRILLKNQNQKS